MATMFSSVIGFLVDYWWVFAIVVAVVVIITFILKKQDKFIVPRKPLEEIYEEEMVNNVEVSGIKSFKKYLRIGFIKVGKIWRIANINWTMPVTNKKNSYETVQFLELAVIKDDIISKLLANFKIGIKYFLVDKHFIKGDVMDMDQDDIIIEENCQYWNAKGMGIFSKEGRKIAEALAWKHAHFNALEEVANFIPKQTYFEVRTARQTEKARMLTELEKDRWGSRTERAVEGGE